MHSLQPVSREQALAEIPDTPTTVEFRAIALDPGSALYRSGDGLLLVDSQKRLVGAIGAVVSQDVDTLYQIGKLDCELLADLAAYERLRIGRAFERAIIQTLPGPWRRPDCRIADLVIRPLDPSDPLDLLPHELRHEIDRERQLEIVFAGFVDGTAVSFAYSSSCTEMFSDISIDTLQEHRGRGLGAAVVSSLIDRIVEEGSAPVWGAVTGNRASRRLAEKLGFTHWAGELFVSE